MKKIGFALFCAALIGLAIYGQVKADSGLEAATRKEEGTYGATRVVTISSNTGTAIWSGNTKRPDGTCFNNSAVTIWIGTTTVTQSPHPNVLNGFPVLSSATIRLDGSYSGEIDATCNTGSATCEMRCLDGLVN